MFCRHIQSVQKTCFCPETGVPMIGQRALEVTYNFPGMRTTIPTVYYSWNSILFEKLQFFIEDGTAVMVPDQER